MARLIGIYWDEDRGLVDLDARQVLMYCNGHKIDSHFNNNIPTLELDTRDFELIVPAFQEEGQEYSDDFLYDVANWDNVCQLLLHADFVLEKRLSQPEALSQE